LHSAYLQQANIYEQVKNFEKNNNHSENFTEVMKWLQESMI